MSLTKYPINPDLNYWQQNPQVKFIKPFDEIYQIDNGSDTSSKMMYVITFMCDPDEKENAFFRMNEDTRKLNLTTYYPEIDWNDPIFIKGLNAYPFEVMDTIQRALKEELESIKIRANLISETPYTLDDYLKEEDGSLTLDKTGKPIQVKGTWKQLDDMRKATKKIYEDLDTTIDKYFNKKADDIRVRGGRKESLSERGLI